MASMAMLPCFVTSAAGRKLEVPNAVFVAFEEMMQKYQATGTVQVEFKNGGVAGVTVQKRLK